jgi:uncharacterized protein YdeI (YjbR/CyaY-like superfamily)
MGDRTDEDPIVFFPDPAAWRSWLARHHERRPHLWVGFHKRATGRPSITWPEAVDQALCFGWIDGIRKSIDEARYKIRFTPRRATSLWSKINIQRVAALTRQGLMQPAGLVAFGKRKRTGVYSYEQTRRARLPLAFEQRFRAETAAWAYFQERPPWYRKAVTHWVVSAKKEETRERRLGLLIEHSSAGRLIPPLRRPGTRAAS